MKVSLLFPHQLFEKSPALVKDRPVYLVEEFLFFSQYPFLKQKLVFHRASMKAFAAHLAKKGYRVFYIEACDARSDIRTLLAHMGKEDVMEIHYIEVTDCWLHQRLTRAAAQQSIRLVRYESPHFLLTSSQLQEYFSKRSRYHQTDFYKLQRNRFRLLVDDEGKPAGGKWTFDDENRLRYPKGRTPPKVNFPVANEFWKEACDYVTMNFPSNPGQVNTSFIYPTTFTESRAWLEDFLASRLAEFGHYEDALVASERVLHHSVLTPMLNSGLLTPEEVVRNTVAYAGAKGIPLNSLEGFVRQIIGWREFIRGVYEVKGIEERTKNFWKFKRKIPASFWTGTTTIAPVDLTIKKVLETGYCHHIERLMVLGNFMLLCEFDPDEVYRWFMELFIDAYDWVMVPNVYGMSQFADGGLMATKPYISGSNYLMKMSDYPKGEWQAIWDGLFWRFLHTHRSFFLSNPRLSMLVKTFDKMPLERRKEHLERAEEYLESLS